MEKSRILRLLTLHVVFFSPLLKSCSAEISFTMRQAAFIVGGIGVLYIILCLVFLFVICRILPSNKKCRCCHKGKVCPRIPSSSDVHKGKDFLQQDRFTLRKKSTVVQPVAKLPNLLSIPEDDNIIPNPVAFEEESVQSSLAYLNRTTSTSTAITSVQDDAPFERSPTSSPLQSGGSLHSRELTEYFEKKARENSGLDPGYSSSPLMNEIALEIGMLKRNGKTSEYVNHPNQATLHDETAFNDNKKVESKQTGKADKKDDNTRQATTSKSTKLPPLFPSPITTSPKNKGISKGQSQSTAEQLPKQGIKDDVFDEEFIIEPPNVLGSSDTAPVITSPVIAATPPLPPVKVKKLNQVDSSSLHKLDYFKLSGTPDTKSLPDMVKADGNGVKNRTTLYSKQVFQTEAQYTPPPSAKNKTKRAPPQLITSYLTAASSAKNIPTSYQNSGQERAVSSHPNIDTIGRAADSKVTTTTSDTVRYIKAESIMKQKSEVCVVEEAGSGNELTLI